jgi:hypothetical protein
MTALARTEGQRLLQTLGLGPTALAHELEVTKGATSLWLTGQRIPVPEMRRTIESKYGVPAHAWDIVLTVDGPVAGSETTSTAVHGHATEPEPPEAAAKRGPGRVAKLAVAGAPAGAQAVTIDGLEELDRLITECNRGMRLNGLTVNEADKWQTRLLKTIEARERLLNLREVREDEVRKSPTWCKIRDALVATLVQWPEAAQAVLDKLDELGA